MTKTSSFNWRIKMTRKPFDESIVIALNGGGCDVETAMELITITSITSNHDAIVEAIKEAYKNTYGKLDNEDEYLTEVLSSLKDQKREAEAEKQEQEARKKAEKGLFNDAIASLGNIGDC